MSDRAVRRSESAAGQSPLSGLYPWLGLVWLLLFWILFFTSHLPNASTTERPVHRLDVVALLPEIFAELMSPSAEGGHSGWKFLPQRFDIATLAAIIVLICFAAGHLTMRALRISHRLDAPSALALAGGIGFSVVSLFTLVCGQLGLLWWWWFVAAGAVVIGAEGIFRGQSRRTTSNPAPVPQYQASRSRMSCVVVCVPFLCCMLLGAMLPPTDFDVKEYHLEGPKEYFIDGHVHFLPHNVYTSFPFLTEMLSLTGMVLRGDWLRGALVGQTVLMAFAPLTALGVYCVGQRLAGNAAGWLGAMAYLTTPWTYRISIIAYTEGALCCYVVLTLLAFLIWREQTGSPPAAGENVKTGRPSPFIPEWNWLVVLGVLAGSAVSTKYPGMVLVAIPFALAVGTSTFMSRDTFRQRALPLFLYALGVTVACGPWMLKNLGETGNPVYPLLYSVFGGRDWDAEQNAKWKHAHAAKLLQNGWGDVKGVIFQNDWQSPLLCGLAPLALLQRRKQAVAGVILYAFAILAAWYLLTHRIDRFWVPVNSVLAVLAGCGLAAMMHLPQEERGIRRRGSEAGQGVPLLIQRCGVIGLIGFAVIFNLAFITTPLCGYNAYLLDETLAWKQTQTPSIAAIEAMALPPEKKVLFVGEAAVFNARFPYVYNTVFDKDLFEVWTARKTSEHAWEMFPAEEIRKQFQSQGITHLFVNWNEILRYRTTYGFTDYVTPERFDDLVTSGILAVVPVPQELGLRTWEDMDPSWQQEVQGFAPSLRVIADGIPAMIQYQCYRVIDQ